MMSASNRVAGPSTDNFIAIFDAAATKYHSLTGKHLETHPLAAQLDSCRSPEAVSNILRTQALAFSKFRKADAKLMAWLDPMVNVLFTFSATLGEGIGLPFSPAKTIFTGVGVLLGAARDVAASHDVVIRLFERIHFFLGRLNIYIGIPLTNDLTALLGNVMAHLLVILALSTKVMTDGRMKKILKRLAGKKDVEDALEKLDVLTKEEISMTVARNLQLAHDVDGNVTVIKHIIGGVDSSVKQTEALTEVIDANVKTTKALTEVVGNDVKVIDHNVRAAKHTTDELKRVQLQEKYRTWLSPPDPSINHNTAHKTQHHGTATWFIKGNAFREWKQSGSLLWIRGNPGAGKSVLCSAIIEDVKNIRGASSTLTAYYYFDFRDASKRTLHGLLTSLLFQLGDDDEHCKDILSRLYKTCRDGSERPSDSALVKCLESMLNLPGQLPIFIIIDALDECPSNTGTPSAREEVLNFVENLVGSNHSNLFLCITSRPEQDIQTVLNPLTSARYRVSLHNEVGQREDINSYVRSFVHEDREMRRWRKEDRELVITTLCERALGMFRWVFCQLDTLRRCMPSSIVKALNELPDTLDGTYERALEEIPKEKWHHAHRLFQCLVAAIRPLRVEELVEIFAIEFDPDARPTLTEGWRPENAEDAVLSACSTLITIISNKGSKVVQFSHFSVKEYLTSDRLRTSEVGNLRRYHIPLDAAHTILAHACRAVLLQLDDKVVKKRIAGFPLAFYSARHWVDHSKYDETRPEVRRVIEELLDPMMPYLAAWAWMYDVDQPWSQHPASIKAPEEHPSVTPRSGPSLYYAALYGFKGMIEYLISTHGQDVIFDTGHYGTPLHAASYGGHIDIVRVLLNHGADVSADRPVGSPLDLACQGGHLDIMRLLLEHGASVDGWDGLQVLQAATSDRHLETSRPLLQCNLNINAVDYWPGWTALHWVHHHPKVIKLLLEYGADPNTRSVTNSTPLYMASEDGVLESVQTLLTHGADVHIRGDRNLTPFQVATSRGHREVAELLLKHGAVAEQVDVATE